MTYLGQNSATPSTNLDKDSRCTPDSQAEHITINYCKSTHRIQDIARWAASHSLSIGDLPVMKFPRVIYFPLCFIWCSRIGFYYVSWFWGRRGCFSVCLRTYKSERKTPWPRPNFGEDYSPCIAQGSSLYLLFILNSQYYYSSSSNRAGWLAAGAW